MYASIAPKFSEYNDLAMLTIMMNFLQQKLDIQGEYDINRHNVKLFKLHVLKLVLWADGGPSLKSYITCLYIFDKSPTPAGHLKLIKLMAHNFRQIFFNHSALLPQNQEDCLLLTVMLHWYFKVSFVNPKKFLFVPCGSLSYLTIYSAYSYHYVLTCFFHSYLI